MPKLRDAIKASQDLVAEVIDVPEWGVKLEMRSMSAAERAQAIRSWTVDPDAEETKVDQEKFYPVILIHTAHDPETGERVFSDEDVEWLNGKSSAVLERLARIGMRLSGMDRKAVDAAGEGSSATPNGGSSST